MTKFGMPLSSTTCLVLFNVVICSTEPYVGMDDAPNPPTRLPTMEPTYPGTVFSKPSTTRTSMPKRATTVKGSRITERGVTWHPCNDWALGCDFPGNDLSHEQVPSAQCGGRCAATTGCTHFSWTLFNGGTCWMKRGNIRKSHAIVTTDQSVVCGIISTSSNYIDWQYGSWALGCDFPGNDLSSRHTSGEKCGDTCSSTTGCTHFTWTWTWFTWIWFNGGTCWLKQGNAQKSDAVAKADKSIVCGLSVNRFC